MVKSRLDKLEKPLKNGCETLYRRPLFTLCPYFIAECIFVQFPQSVSFLVSDIVPLQTGCLHVFFFLLLPQTEGWRMPGLLLILCRLLPYQKRGQIVYTFLPYIANTKIWGIHLNHIHTWDMLALFGFYYERQYDHKPWKATKQTNKAPSMNLEKKERKKLWGKLIGRNKFGPVLIQNNLNKELENGSPTTVRGHFIFCCWIEQNYNQQ